VTLPAKITEDVFLDNELTNQVKWYQRIFTVINALIDFLTGYPPDTGLITAGSITATTGNTLNNFNIQKVGRVVQLNLLITVGSLGAGNITNITVANINDPELCPLFEAALLSGSSGITANGHIAPSGAIAIDSTTLSATATNYAISLNATYLAPA
jgi:hypothetical protein